MGRPAVRLTLLFLLLGILSGGLSAYKMARRTIEREQEEKEKEEKAREENWKKRQKCCLVRRKNDMMAPHFKR